MLIKKETNIYGNTIERYERKKEKFVGKKAIKREPDSLDRFMELRRKPWLLHRKNF